jgi:LacI family transcriptional regulator
MTVSIKKKRATIRDVGRRALVSHQTVSRVINGELSIAPATRARVERAIAELGFHPNHVARSLARRKTFTVGIVIRCNSSVARAAAGSGAAPKGHDHE